MVIMYFNFPRFTCRYFVFELTNSLTWTQFCLCSGCCFSHSVSFVTYLGNVYERGMQNVRHYTTVLLLQRSIPDRECIDQVSCVYFIQAKKLCSISFPSPSFLWGFSTSGSRISQQFVLIWGLFLWNKAFIEIEWTIFSSALAPVLDLCLIDGFVCQRFMFCDVRIHNLKIKEHVYLCVVHMS